MPTIPFWSKAVSEIAQSVNSSINGLSQKDAQDALRRVGPNRIQSKERVTPLGLFLNQFKSPIVCHRYLGLSPGLGGRRHHSADRDGQCPA